MSQITRGYMMTFLPCLSYPIFMPYPSCSLMHLVPQALQAGPDRRGCGDQSLGHTGLSWDFRNLSITYDNLIIFEGDEHPINPTNFGVKGTGALTHTHISTYDASSIKNFCFFCEVCVPWSTDSR